MENYRCPVCKKPLTKQEYERALGVWGEREKHFQHQKAELQRKLLDAKEKEKKAKNEGIKVERARTQRLMAGKDKTIQALKERVDQLKKGSTPQTEGLEFEEKLAARLCQEFPEDDIQHKGKGGDVLHIVMVGDKAAGVIIYECKRTPRIQNEHIQQAHLAKQSRKADFAVLVTTGQKKGFSGLIESGGVLVVAPLGAIPLAALLRQHLIAILRAGITKEKRAVVADHLLKYITSPQFKNPIEEVVKVATELQDMIKEEAAEHYRNWKRRWDRYQMIQWDSSLIHDNVKLIQEGKEPREIPLVKFPPLQLPAPKE